MLESFPIALGVSILLGFLAGIGVGGGSLLMLWLTLVLQVPYPDAKVINLLFFLPAALITSLFRWKQGHLPLKKVFPAILAGCIAALVGSWLCTKIHTDWLEKAFGTLLLLTGIRELLYKPK